MLTYELDSMAQILECGRSETISNIMQPPHYRCGSFHTNKNFTR